MSEHLAVEEINSLTKSPQRGLPQVTPVVSEEMTEMARENRGPREVIIEEKRTQSSVWRVLNQVRGAIPYISRLLPLVDGGIGNIAAALALPLASHHQSREQAAAMEAFEKTAIEIQNGQRELRSHLQEQAIEFKQVEEQLERLREATERNTLEQAELIEDLKSFAGTVRVLGACAIVLLVAVAGIALYIALSLRH